MSTHCLLVCNVFFFLSATITQLFFCDAPLCSSISCRWTEYYHYRLQQRSLADSTISQLNHHTANHRQEIHAQQLKMCFVYIRQYTQSGHTVPQSTSAKMLAVVVNALRLVKTCPRLMVIVILALTRADFVKEYAGAVSW